MKKPKCLADKCKCVNCKMKREAFRQSLEIDKRKMKERRDG